MFLKFNPFVTVANGKFNIRIPYVDIILGHPVLKSLGKAKYISTLDAEKGYWQVPIAELSKKYTAFRTRNGLYEYNVLPFGLKNSPATYQRIMNEVLHGLSDFCLVYQDDNHI